MFDFSRIEKINFEFSEAQKKAQIPKSDAITHLPARRRIAWQSLLSSAASAEAEEEHLVRPLIDAFANSPAIVEYLNRHADDELRHAVELQAYLKTTFGYVKTKRTLSDRIFYDLIFKGLGPLMQKRPLVFIATLLFYEVFAEDFYTTIRKKADQDQLSSLSEYLRRVQHDELRHRAGIKLLFAYWSESEFPLYKSDFFWMKVLIGVVRLDISANWWALWNRKLRRSLKALDIDPSLFNQKAKDYARLVHRELATFRQ